MPTGYAERVAQDLKRMTGARDGVLVLPYATAVVVTNYTLWQSIKAWWATRHLKARAEA